MILILLIGAHFLADFTLQTNNLAIKKATSFKYLLLHSAVYAVVTAAVGFVFVRADAVVWPVVIIAVSHFVIDCVRIKIDKKLRTGYARFCSFVVDQLLHLGIIIALYYVFRLGEAQTYIADYCFTTDKVRGAIVCVVIWIIIWEPASVFVRKLFNSIDNVTGESCSVSEPRAGSIIGKLERFVLAVLVLINQVNVIGFVLTAKSVARFKQLEDKDFAEKYLVGTLTSAIIAIVTTLILRNYI